MPGDEREEAPLQAQRCGGRHAAEHGGATRTWTALNRHGLRDVNGITAEGHAVIPRATQERA